MIFALKHYNSYNYSRAPVLGQAAEADSVNICTVQGPWSMHRRINNSHGQSQQSLQVKSASADSLWMLNLPVLSPQSDSLGMLGTVKDSCCTDTRDKLPRGRWAVHQICKTMQQICVKYAWNMHNICKVYAVHYMAFAKTPKLAVK